MSVLAACDTLHQSIQSRPLVAPSGTTDPLVAEDGHYRPAKPPSSLLERLQLVLNGLTAITGADPHIQGGASGGCCHAGSISRIARSSIAMIEGQGLAGRGLITDGPVSPGPATRSRHARGSGWSA